MKINIHLYLVILYLIFSVSVKGQHVYQTNDSIYTKTLYYFDKNLASIPDSILKYKSLNNICFVENCNIDWQNIANQLKGFENIEMLSIQHHDLSSFPKELTILNNIKRLDLRQNIIRFFPEEVKQMNLIILDISLNNLYLCSKDELKSLFKSMSFFLNLKYLDIGENGLYKLPNNISCLKKIEFLRISNNNFMDLPKILYKMNNLSHIYIDCYPNLLKSDTRYLLKMKGLKRITLNMSSFSKLQPFTIEEYEKLCKKYPTIQFDY